MDVELVLCLLWGNHCCVFVFAFCEFLFFFCIRHGRSMRFAWRMGNVNVLPLLVPVMRTAATRYPLQEKSETCLVEETLFLALTPSQWAEICMRACGQVSCKCLPIYILEIIRLYFKPAIRSSRP